jgi:hypothetical protein
MDQAGVSAVYNAAPFAPLPPTDEKEVDIEFSLDYRVHSH